MIVRDDDGLTKWRNAMAASDVVVYDVETSGLSWHTDFICGYVFTVGPKDEDTFYLPVRHRDGGNIEGGHVPHDQTEYNRLRHRYHHRVDGFVREIAAERPRLWVGHNIKFDLHMSASHDIHLNGDVEDTAVLAALLDENQRGYSLENCCEVMGVTPKKVGIYDYISQYLESIGEKVSDSGKSIMGHFWKLPGDGEAGEYAEGDGISTWELWAKQTPIIVDEELTTVRDVERKVTRTLYRMERRGAPVNEEVLNRVVAKVEHELERARKALPKGFNVRSMPQVKDLYLSKGYGDDDLKTTAKGNYSFPEDWLEEHGGQIGKDIILVRKLSNLNSTFLQSAIKSNIVDGRIHANFNQLKGDEYGTVSGRLSCSQPNLQQIPKRDKILAPLIRQIFHDPERLWVSFDYSQQEYRVFADFAQSKVVLEAYANDPNTDYHQLVADLLGVERDPAAKRINLGTIYNMGAAKLAASLGVEVWVAKGFLRKMRRMMPEAREFNRACEEVARSQGYVRTLLKRRRRFPNSDIAHKAGNAVIQGSSADITKYAMMKVEERLTEMGFASNLILQIHDSLEFMADPVELDEVKVEIRRVMEDLPDAPFSLEVPMKTDIGVGLSWGHATFPKYENFLIN